MREMLPEFAIIILFICNCLLHMCIIYTFSISFYFLINSMSNILYISKLTRSQILNLTRSLTRSRIFFPVMREVRNNK